MTFLRSIGICAQFTSEGNGDFREFCDVTIVAEICSSQYVNSMSLVGRIDSPKWLLFGFLPPNFLDVLGTYEW